MSRASNIAVACMLVFAAALSMAGPGPVSRAGHGIWGARYIEPPAGQSMAKTYAWSFYGGYIDPGRYSAIDSIIVDTDQSHARYMYVSADSIYSCAQLSTQRATTESEPANYFCGLYLNKQACIWYDWDSVIPPGANIIEARLYFVIADRPSWTFGEGEGFLAVLDTLSGDLPWIGDAGNCATAWGADASWGYREIGSATTWPVSFDTRCYVDDWGVPGPINYSLQDPFSGATYDTLYVDVTDLVAAAINNDAANGGFWLLAIDAQPRPFDIMCGAGAANNGRNPTLFVRFAQ